MSKRLLDYCMSRPVTDNSHYRKIARYLMIEKYLTENNQNTIWTYQSGNHPNCTDIDDYFHFQHHVTEKIVNDEELFTRRADFKGWCCREIAYNTMNRGGKKAEQTVADILREEDECLEY